MRFLISIICILFLFQCKRKCDLLAHDVIPLRFDPAEWHVWVDTGRIDQDNNELLGRYYKALQKRERMLCDLDNFIKKEKYSIRQIKRLLGPGSGSNQLPSGWIKVKQENGIIPKDDYWTLYLKTDMPNKLLYQSGVNASGICRYFIIVYEGKLITGNIVAI